MTPLLLLVGLACSTETPRPAQTPAPTEPAPVAPAPPDAAPPTAPLPDGAAPDGATPDGTTTVPTLLGDAPGVAFVGNWTSKECGGRAYARNVHFEADHGYSGIDLVSPCPKGTTCVWSGMVGFAGIWKQEGTALQLREIGAPAAAGGPHPTKFEATADGKLVENGCLYERGLTVPEGYTEADVQPRIPGAVKEAAGAEGGAEGGEKGGEKGGGATAGGEL